MVVFKRLCSWMFFLVLIALMTTDNVSSCGMALSC